jgi:hypothetical protein
MADETTCFCFEQVVILVAAGSRPEEPITDKSGVQTLKQDNMLWLIDSFPTVEPTY